MTKSPLKNDFFYPWGYGTRGLRTWRSRRIGRFTDLVFDLPLLARGIYRRIEKGAATLPPQKVLIVSVVVPGRETDLQKVLAALKDTRHPVTVALVPMEGRGKFDNINHGLADYDLDEFDWLIVTDDDIDLPAKFLDKFLYLTSAAGLKLAMPAHRFRSHWTYDVTRRWFNSAVRTTHYVECGPLTAFHRDIYKLLIPFPPLRWAWGMDIHWAEIARNRNIPIGIVDGTPVGHLKPVASTYSAQAAVEEARIYLQENGVDRPKPDILRTIEILPIP